MFELRRIQPPPKLPASVAAGFSVIQTCALSLLLFSGASQFAVVGVMAAGGSALSAIATGGLLGIRNGLYALRMAPILRFTGIKKFSAAQITIDESIGVALSQETRGESAMRFGFLSTGIGVFIFWNFFLNDGDSCNYCCPNFADILSGFSVLRMDESN